MARCCNVALCALTLAVYVVEDARNRQRFAYAKPALVIAPGDATLAARVVCLSAQNWLLCLFLLFSTYSLIVL